VVEPRFAHELPARELIRWRIDTASGTATQETHAGALGVFKVPLEPWWAASGGAFRRAGDFHGDLRAARRQYGLPRLPNGVTAYLPVSFRERSSSSAMARDPGDGEIVGTGLETAFEMQFTLRVIKGKQINWPRGEDDASIFTIGNARPLELALQHATTEMVRWLRGDYG